MMRETCCVLRDFACDAQRAQPTCSRITYSRIHDAPAPAATPSASSTNTGRIARRYSREARWMLLRGSAPCSARWAASAKVAGSGARPIRTLRPQKPRCGHAATGPMPMAAAMMRLPSSVQHELDRAVEGRQDQRGPAARPPPGRAPRGRRDREADGRDELPRRVDVRAARPGKGIQHRYPAFAPSRSTTGSSASNAIAMIAPSAAGMACTRLPPHVAADWIGAAPTEAAASTSAWTCCCKYGCSRSIAKVTAAPTVT